MDFGICFCGIFSGVLKDHCKFCRSRYYFFFFPFSYVVGVLELCDEIGSQGGGFGSN